MIKKCIYLNENEKKKSCHFLNGNNNRNGNDDKDAIIS